MNCINQVEVDIKYDIYIKRQLSDIKQFEQEQQTLIPKEINFNEIKGLSNESIDILNRYKPETIRQASLMPGFTSSAVFLLLYYIRNKTKVGLMKQMFSTFKKHINVSCETLEKLMYFDLLCFWQKKMNLVSNKSLYDAEIRHFLDSAQLYKFCKDISGNIIDFGSGAGFPGAVLSILGVSKTLFNRIK